MAPRNRLAELRQSQGLSRRQLAARLDLSERTGDILSDKTIERWEKGVARIPEGRTAELALFFGVSRAYLVGWDD